MTDRLDEETERKIAALGDAMNGADDLAAAHALRSRIRTLADEARPKRDFDPPRTKDGSVAIMARITRPFPWSAEIKGPDDAVVFCGSHGNPSTYATIAECHTEADAMFIAYAPTLIELLLQEIDRMEHGDPVPPPSSPTSEPPDDKPFWGEKMANEIRGHLGYPPLPATSEPIPASDQLREALADLDAWVLNVAVSSKEARMMMASIRGRIEQVSGAQLGEIERLRRGLFGVERELADEIKRTTTREAELASLRSSALTAEEAQDIDDALQGVGLKAAQVWARVVCKLRRLSALRSSTPDKGNTK